MSNRDAALEMARPEGVVHTLYPPDVPLPTAAPVDLGRAAARLLTDDAEHTGIRYVEGPTPYTAADVARAFAAALGRDVRAVETPRAQWIAAFRELGFSQAAATSYARMTGATLDRVGPGRPRPSAAPRRSRTTSPRSCAGTARAGRPVRAR